VPEMVSAITLFDVSFVPAPLMVEIIASRKKIIKKFLKKLYSSY
jgi:hypothetical protein